MRVDIWSDLVCPWCYVGKRRLERALESFPHRDDVTLVHRAYLLYGGYPRGESFDRRDMLMKKYQRSREEADAMNAGMERTAAADGLEYHLQGGVTGNTFDAHQLVYLGRDRGRQDAVLERLYRAFFTEQRSIFDHASLVELGAEAGLDGDEIARVLREDAYAAAIAADVEAGHAPGESRVNGVPFFVFDGRYAVSGAQSSDVFAAALARVSAGASAPPITA